MKRLSSAQTLRAAAILSLVGLVLIVWSVLDPRPPPVLIGLSAGQAIGSVGFFIYLVVVVRDLRRARAASPPPDSERPRV